MGCRCHLKNPPDKLGIDVVPVEGVDPNTAILSSGKHAVVLTNVGKPKP